MGKTLIVPTAGPTQRHDAPSSDEAASTCTPNCLPVSFKRSFGGPTLSSWPYRKARASRNSIFPLS